ncbi:MAG: superoxide dismutase [Alloprevotella sp.]|nr:superoxide dismutase [Alloprevotella sp.]
MTHEMPRLPYGAAALAPRMSAETLEHHYGKHLRTYIDNLNRLATGTPFADMTLEETVRRADGALLNNAAQAWNHTFFFETLSPTPSAMGSGMRHRAEAAFGSAEAFREALLGAAAGIFGSGWAWAVLTPEDKLELRALPNAGCPLREPGLTPLLTIDVWEHAYYIDYRNRRADYLQSVWELTDWEKVEMRIARGLFG